MINITKEQFEKLKKEGAVFPVVLEANGDEVTPINIFYSLKSSNRCLLESVFSDKQGGRYSFIGAEPYMTITSDKDNITIRNDKDEIENKKGKVLEILKELLKVNYNPLGSKIPFSGGAIGYVGYDVIRQYERIPDNNVKEIDIPEAALTFYKIVICYDHYRHKIYYIYNVQKEDIDYDEIYKKLNTLNKATESFEGKFPLPASENKEFSSNLTEKQYCAMVEKAKEYITKGDIFQVVLSQRLSVKTNDNPFEIYRRLRSANPSPYLFYIEFDGFQVVGSSPESLVSVQEGVVTTNPIAGTRPRGKTDEEDTVLKEELLKDEKEVAEHVMLVDLGRNDVGKISRFGSVKVNRFMEVDYYSHVMHIVSTVSGKLKKGLDYFDALTACLPAGTVSGAPKIRAMEIIDELEKVKRGLYSGALGYFSYDGNMDVCIAIRTLIIKDNYAYVQAGAGIVYDSVPEMEYKETLNKARALREVI